jgi:small subunit ribosomal protein S9
LSDAQDEEQGEIDEPTGDAPTGESVEQTEGQEETAAAAAGSEDGPTPESGETETPEPAKAEAPKTGKESVPGEAPKAKDLPPGADLEPISIEPEVELDAEERARQEAEAEEKAAREAELNRDDAGEEERIEVAGAIELPGDGPIQSTGKRKRSVARVLMLPGKGTITVNGRDFEEYFPRARHRTIVSSPLVATGFDDKVEVRVLVHGGGISGQAGAARHGIARGLTEAMPELRSELKRRGFLTRDSRAKERRKAGLKKARKRPQFSKR